MGNQIIRYPNITRARFLSRPNRFIAVVDLDGSEERVHVKNTGRCGELLVPGSEVFLTEPGTPGRKTRFDLVAVRKSTGVLFNIDSQAPNRIVREYLAQQDFDRVIPEYTYGSSRLDFFMEKTFPGGACGRWLMEVKGCTLERGGTGFFPDAPTQRGTRHIQELIRAKAEGYHAVLAFVIQMDGVTRVLPNEQTDPAFAEALHQAEDAGVQILFLPCRAEPDALILTDPQPLLSSVSQA